MLIRSSRAWIGLNTYLPPLHHNSPLPPGTNDDPHHLCTRAGNTDGVDIDCSRNVTVSDFYYQGGDDAIAVKAGEVRLVDVGRTGIFPSQKWRIGCSACLMCALIVCATFFIDNRSIDSSGLARVYIRDPHHGRPRPTHANRVWKWVRRRIGNVCWRETSTIPGHRR